MHQVCQNPAVLTRINERDRELAYLTLHILSPAVVGSFSQSKPMTTMPPSLAFSPLQAQFSEYPTPSASSGPYGITAGPDGALWFTESFSNMIGRATTSGSTQITYLFELALAEFP